MRDYYILSFICFCGIPLLVFALLLGIYVFGNNKNPNMADFLSIALPNVIFNVVLVYGFFKFREKIEGEMSI